MFLVPICIPVINVHAPDLILLVNMLSICWPSRDVKVILL